MSEKAVKFYAGVSGSEALETPRVDGAKRWLLVSQGYARASVIEIPPKRTDARPGWVGYVRVTEVGPTVAFAQQLGGRVLVAPWPELFEGKVALLMDPGGAVFGILEWDEVETESAK